MFKELNCDKSIISNIVYGRRHLKLFTNCHVSRDTLYLISLFIQLLLQVCALVASLVLISRTSMGNPFCYDWKRKISIYFNKLFNIFISCKASLNMLILFLFQSMRYFLTSSLSIEPFSKLLLSIFLFLTCYLSIYSLTCYLSTS